MVKKRRMLGLCVVEWMVGEDAIIYLQGGIWWICPCFSQGNSLDPKTDKKNGWIECKPSFTKRKKCDILLKSCFNYVTGPTLPLLFSRKIWFKRNSNSWMRLVQRTQWHMLMYYSCVSLSAPCEPNIFHKPSFSLALAYTHPIVLLCVS